MFVETACSGFTPVTSASPRSQPLFHCTGWFSKRPRGDSLARHTQHARFPTQPYSYGPTVGTSTCCTSRLHSVRARAHYKFLLPRIQHQKVSYPGDSYPGTRAWHRGLGYRNLGSSTSPAPSGTVGRQLKAKPSMATPTPAIGHTVSYVHPTYPVHLSYGVLTLQKSRPSNLMPPHPGVNALAT